MKPTEQANVAIRAAKNRKQWGQYATARFVIKRGVPFGLYRLALQLEATKELGQ